MIVAACLIAATAAHVHEPLELSDEVALVEVNHWTPSPGEWQHQVIWWDWQAGDTRLRVVDYRMGDPPPRSRRPDGRIEAVWHDSTTGGVLRRVVADWACETWTIHDREYVDRELLPVECRRGLRRTRR